MKKEYILTFCISFLILATVVIISLMIFLPQHATIVENKIEEYASIKKSEYTFKQTNSISFDSLIREYNITDTQISYFKNQKQYVPGNSDPFTAQGSNDTTNNTTNNTAGNSSNTSTQDKITNSNGGVKNPDSTSK